MSDTIILSKGVPFVVDELTEEEELKFYAECGKRTLQIVKEYWLSTGLFYENEEGKLCLKERGEAVEMLIALKEMSEEGADDETDRP